MDTGSLAVGPENMYYFAVGAVGIVIGVFLTILVTKPAVMVTVARAIGALLIAAGTGLLVCGIIWMVKPDAEPGRISGYFSSAHECVGVGAGGLAGGIAAIVLTFFRVNR